MQAREILRPPLWLMALYAFFFGSFVIAIWAAFDTRATVMSCVLSIGALVWIWFASPLRITVSDQLYVGKAHLEFRYIADVEVIDAATMKRLRTRDADPAAFLALRFWTPTGIKVKLNDQRDRTPYWLISSRQGHRLRDALCERLDTRLGKEKG